MVTQNCTYFLSKTETAGRKKSIAFPVSLSYLTYKIFYSKKVKERRNCDTCGINNGKPDDGIYAFCSSAQCPYTERIGIAVSQLGNVYFVFTVVPC
jgi:hypothetical protein